MIPEDEIKYCISIAVQDMKHEDYVKMINCLNIPEKAEKAKAIMDVYELGFRACLKQLGDREECRTNQKKLKLKRHG